MNGDIWQLCPKCNGTGGYYNANFMAITSICDVCNGLKIISKLTGKPPKDIDLPNINTASTC